MDQKNAVVGADITGTVTINYDGRFDGIQLNTYITGANDQVLFTDIDGKKISFTARIYVGKDAIGDKRLLKFTARVERSSKEESRIRFRTAMIQEHKEIASDTVFLPLRAR